MRVSPRAGVECLVYMPGIHPYYLVPLRVRLLLRGLHSHHIDGCCCAAALLLPCNLNGGGKALPGVTNTYTCLVRVYQVKDSSSTPAYGTWYVLRVSLW